MSTIILLYLLGYFPARQWSPEMTLIPQRASYSESLDRDPYEAADGRYDDSNSQSPSVSQATRRAHQPDHHSWWENDSSPHADPTSFFDFNASR